MFLCLKPGCPIECGTRRHPGCVDRILRHTLLLLLAAVLAVSLASGVRDLHTAVRSQSLIGEPPPIASTEMVQLVSETSDDAR